MVGNKMAAVALAAKQDRSIWAMHAGPRIPTGRILSARSHGNQGAHLRGHGGWR